MVDISKAMTDWKISSVAITDEQNKRVIGILTERDVVSSIAKGAHPEKVSAGSLMSAPVLSIRNDLTIEEAARLMIKKKVRHFLVEDACHGIVGIITTTDVARYLKHRMQKGSDNSSDELLSEVWELFF